MSAPPGTERSEASTGAGGGGGMGPAGGFGRLDSNSDGRIDVSELRAATRHWRAVSDRELARMIRSADRDKSGDVDMQEFLSLVRVFRDIDADHDGYIARKELQAVLTRHGSSLTPRQVGQLLKRADRDGDKKIDMLEFWGLYARLPPPGEAGGGGPVVTVPRAADAEQLAADFARRVERHVADQPAELSAMQDFLAGSCAGAAATVVGHPFDTIKVRLQLEPDVFKSVPQCMRLTLKEEGFRGFYKGMGSPLITVPLVNAVVFASYGQAKYFFERRAAAEADAAGDDEVRELTLVEIMSAGAFAGLVNSVVVGPVELIKCNLQAATKTNIGSWQCTKNIYKAGGIRGLGLGMSSTIFREVPSYIAQFGTYETLRKWLTPEGEDTTDLSPARTMLAGGLAGCCCWLFSYPPDIVKTYIQLQPVGKPRRFKPLRYFPDGGMVAATQHLYGKYGIKGFFRGLSPCLMRAFPANGAGFLAFEMARKVLLSTFS